MQTYASISLQAPFRNPFDARYWKALLEVRQFSEQVGEEERPGLVEYKVLGNLAASAWLSHESPTSWVPSSRKDFYETGDLNRGWHLYATHD